MRRHYRTYWDPLETEEEFLEDDPEGCQDDPEEYSPVHPVPLHRKEVRLGPARKQFGSPSSPFCGW